MTNTMKEDNHFCWEFVMPRVKMHPIVHTYIVKGFPLLIVLCVYNVNLRSMFEQFVRLNKPIYPF